MKILIAVYDVARSQVNSVDPIFSMGLRMPNRDTADAVCEFAQNGFSLSNLPSDVLLLNPDYFAGIRQSYLSLMSATMGYFNAQSLTPTIEVKIIG